MDQVVQQNASLVEEASAATESMKSQAGLLLQMVSRFKLAEGETPYARATPTSSLEKTALEPVIPQPIQVKSTPAKVSTKFSGVHGASHAAGTEWKEF
jgi:hypothetical protein